MSERWEIVPGRGRVRVDDSPISGMICYNSGSNSRPRESAYDRLKAEVYATGNKWAIENFHATHD